MKLKKGFLKKTIGTTEYLIPFGQRLPELFYPLQLNMLSSHIIDMLAKDISTDSLLEHLYSFLEAETDEEKNQVYNDVMDFIQYLDINQYLDTDLTHHSLIKRVMIGGININLHSDDGSLCFDKYNDFERTTGKHDLSINYVTGDLNRPVGYKLLLSTSDLEAYENDKEYVLCPRILKYVSKITILKDGKTAYILHDMTTDCSTLEDELFQATRFAFLYHASKKGIFALHSASILYQDKAILFTGPSGTGKSTHASLWEKLFNTTMINGDLNLLQIRETDVVVMGSPWCGTSNIYSNKEYTLGAVVRLYQNMLNSCTKADSDKAGFLLYQRLISPTWSESLMSDAVDFACELSTHIPVFELNCNKDDDAAFTSRAEIDKYL